MKTKNTVAIIVVLVLAVIVGHWVYSADQEMKQLNKESCILSWERQAQKENLVTKEIDALEKLEGGLKTKIGGEINEIITIDDECRPVIIKNDYKRYLWSGERREEELNEIDRRLKLSMLQILFTQELVRGVQLDKIGYTSYNAWLKDVTSERVTSATKASMVSFDSMMVDDLKTARGIVDLTWDKIPEDRKRIHEKNYRVITKR